MTCDRTIARVSVALSPLDSGRKVVEIPGDEHTVGQLLDATGLERSGLYATVNGRAVPVELVDQTIVPASSIVVVSRRPGGPAVAAFFVAVGEVIATGAVALGASELVATLVAYVLTTAIFVGAQIALTRLLAPSAPDISGSPPGVRRSIAGSRNGVAPYAPVPQVLGRHRLYPPLAAAGYTTVEDGKLIQYALFTFGHGQLALSDLKIGDEPLFKSSTTLVYTGQMTSDADPFNIGGKPAVTLELRAGTNSDAAITLFATDIQEQVVATILRDKTGRTEGTRSGPNVRRTTCDRATNITVIVGCPGGLVRINDKGNLENQRSRVEIRYRLVGATTWTSVTTITMKEKTRSSVYSSRSWAVTEGTYEVECNWLTDRNDGDLGIIDETHWVSMLVTRAGSPVRQTGLCLVAARFKITGERSSLVDQFNGVAQTICPDYDSDTSTWITRATSNPASLYRLILQGGANKRPATDAQINLTKLAAWHGECETNGFEFNHVTQGSTTVQNMLRHVCAAGRATPGIQDGKFSVVREVDTATVAPTFHIGPHNSRGFRSIVRYPTIPNALKVQFVDPESGYLDTERIVPDDGYTEATASTFDRLELVGITDADQAYKLGRYRLADLRLRPAEYEVEMGFEHLDMVRGDWGYVTHDVPLLGLARGRVVSVTMSGADCTGVVVNQECPMAAATYGIRFRKSDGTTLRRDVTTVAGNQTTLTFATPITSGNPMPAAGDWFAFGVSGSETAKMIVKEIHPGDDLNARVVLVDAAPGVLTADTTTIPKYDPQISIMPGPQAKSTQLSKPKVLSVTSTNTRDGPSRSASATGGLRIALGASGAAT